MPPEQEVAKHETWSPDLLESAWKLNEALHRTDRRVVEVRLGQIIEIDDDDLAYASS